MSSKSVSSTLFRINLSNNFFNFYQKQNYSELIFYNFIKKLSVYFKFSFFKCFFFKNKTNILIWKNLIIKKKRGYFNQNQQKIKIKKKQFTCLKNNKIIYRGIDKSITFQKEAVKLLCLKLMLNNFYLNSNKVNINILNYKRYSLYLNSEENLDKKKKRTKYRKDKLKKSDFIFNSFLKTLYIPKKFNRLKIKKRLFLNLLIGCLTKNSDIIARSIGNLFELNRSQNLIIKFISFVFTSFPLIFLNLNSLTISIKGKFLKKFGNKKVRARKKIFRFGKEIPLQSIAKPCSYGFNNAGTFVGNFGIRVWAF